MIKVLYAHYETSWCCVTLSALAPFMFIPPASTLMIPEYSKRSELALLVAGLLRNSSDEEEVKFALQQVRNLCTRVRLCVVGSN